MASRRWFPRPCVICGDLSFDSRCEQHAIPKRGGSAAKRGSGGARRTLRRQTLMRDRHTCQVCGVQDFTGRTLHADHVQPLSRGGENTVANMATLCIGCHRSKTDADRQL